MTPSPPPSFATEEDLGVPSPPPGTLRSLGSLLPEALRRAEARRTKAERPVPVPWPEFAEQLGGGLWPGLHLYIGGTGTGKSTLALQLALHAAKAGFPTGYIGLELGELDIALRLLGEEAGVRWSRLYTGRATERDIELATLAAPQLADLPFYVEFGRPTGWPASSLEPFAEQIRAAHPEPPGRAGSCPALLVLDFLQIVGDEQRDDRDIGLDLRERIGRAAYFARDVARRLNVAVLAVSSAARDHYGALAGAGQAHVRCDDKGRRFVASPDALVGMGKESGELEYSADSVTVAVKGPDLPTADGREQCVLLVTAKGRATGASWCALRFEFGHRFATWPGSTEEVLREIDATRKAAADAKTKPKTKPNGDSDSPPNHAGVG